MMSWLKSGSAATAGIHLSTWLHFTMAGIGDTLIMLTENDVPAAKLVYNDVSLHTVVQLNMWLTCRGLETSGSKAELLQR